MTIIERLGSLGRIFTETSAFGPGFMHAPLVFMEYVRNLDIGFKDDPLSRRKHASRKGGCHHIPGRGDVTARPAMIKTQSRLGDLEGNTLIGAHDKTAIVVTQASLDQGGDLPYPITPHHSKEFSLQAIHFATNHHLI